MNDIQILFIFLIFLALFNISLIIVLVIIVRKRKNTDSELFLAQVIISSGIDYYKRLDQMLQEIRILRHDYKHQIEVIRELANISRVKYIQKYLESAMDAFDQTEPSVYCENLVVNVLLSSYAERYSKKNVALSIEVSLPAEIPQLDKSIEPLDTYEICIVLGNILENALEAVLLIPPEQRRVSLLMKLQDDRLLIEEKNSFDGKIALGDGKLKIAVLPASRKGSSGGFGLQSVMAVCKRHCGEYIPKWTDNEYTVYILLNL